MNFVDSLSYNFILLFSIVKGYMSLRVPRLQRDEENQPDARPNDWLSLLVWTWSKLLILTEIQ